MINIYKSLVRPHIEYCVSIWNMTAQHGNWKTIMAIESIQRRFTRLIDGIGILPYEERLKASGLTNLLERRMRGDIIETFKIYKGITNYGEYMFNFSRSGYNIVKSKYKVNMLPELPITGTKFQIG